MEIIALTSAFNLAASVICFIATFRMYSLLRSKDKLSVNVKYYFYALLLISLYLLGGGLPFLFIKDGYQIDLVMAFIRPLLLFGGMFLTLIPINLSRVRVIESFYTYGIIMVTIFSSILSFAGIGELRRASLYKEVDYFTRIDHPLISYGLIMVGISFAASLLFATIFYAQFAFKEKKNEVAFGKAVMMSIGSFLFLFAGLLSHIFGINMDNFLLYSITSSLFFVMGSVAFIATVNYKGEKKKVN